MFGRRADSQAGHFYFKGLIARLEPRLMYDGAVASIDHTAVTDLEDPMLASTHGGPIAARRTHEGRLGPEQRLYRVRLEIERPRPSPAWETSGTLRVKGTRASLFQRFWRYAVAVVIRESGF